MSRDKQVKGERDALVRELEAHQVELQHQNAQLREAQLDLEQARSRYADLYDFAPTPYFGLNHAGCITETNLAGAALFERARDRLIGKPMSVFVTSEDREAFYLHVERCLASTDPVSTDLVLAWEGKRLVVQMTSIRWSDHRNAPREAASCQTSITDITARRATEEALQRAIQTREEFLAIVSHDLRNPLNVISLGAEYLLSTTTETADRTSGRRS
jgi:PAS domain S-box-containing protein